MSHHSPQNPEGEVPGPIHYDIFRWAVAESRNPVCYNGDLLTVEDCAAFTRDYPAVEAVMIGRGAVADPALFRKLRGGAAATRQELETSPPSCTGSIGNSTVSPSRQPSG